MTVASVVSDIDHLCNVIKHDPDSVDLEHVKSVLRQAQVALDVPSSLKYPRGLNIERHTLFGSNGTHEVTITTNVGDEALEELVAWLNGIGED